MPAEEALTRGLDTAIVAAHAEYRKAVIAIAGVEAEQLASPTRAPADVSHIHEARTRVIALEAAREELARIIQDGTLPAGG